MIAVFVRFESDQFDADVIAKIAAEARSMFEGMPGLRSKVFTLAEDQSHATNVYVWDDEQAARAFFSEDLVDMVTGLYGVSPRLEFASVLELIDNA